MHAYKLDFPSVIQTHSQFFSVRFIALFNSSGLLFRSINYDEKDPFLCNACGFCKYARFDFMLYAKPCCAVDPIENEEDRKKVRLALVVS